MQELEMDKIEEMIEHSAINLKEEPYETNNIALFEKELNSNIKLEKQEDSQEGAPKTSVNYLAINEKYTYRSKRTLPARKKGKNAKMGEE